jgi:hypothetical protein
LPWPHNFQEDSFACCKSRSAERASLGALAAAKDDQDLLRAAILSIQ